MRLQPAWWIGVLVFLAYAAWVAGYWLATGVDYRELATEQILWRGVIQPLGIAAIELALFNGLGGWWSPTLAERPRLRRPWLLGLLLLAMLGFIGSGLIVTDWAGIGIRHLAILAAAMLLVGFCEEMVTRGILLVSLRGSLRSEGQVWFWSSLLFGLLHATNALFGIGALALLQVVLAFCVGSGLYLLRRLGGTLLLPMGVHAAWDFSTFSTGMSGEAPSILQTGFLLATYLASVVFTVIVLRGHQAPADARGKPAP